MPNSLDSGLHEVDFGGIGKEEEQHDEEEEDEVLVHAFVWRSCDSIFPCLRSAAWK